MRPASSRRALEILILLILAALGTSILAGKYEPPPAEPCAADYTVCGIAPGMTESEVRRRNGLVQARPVDEQIVSWELHGAEAWFRSGQVVFVFSRQDLYRGSTRLDSRPVTRRWEIVQRIGQEPVETVQLRVKNPPTSALPSEGCTAFRDTYEVSPGCYLIVESEGAPGQPALVQWFWLCTGDLRDRFWKGTSTQSPADGSLSS